ncbi:pyridoxal-dependent decarboxylase, exosortase A system-associated [Streptomyces sp. NPDC059340]|uniref:pyridoxal-dependent decarboxylase, exosortase A system-associated n=1 Tax=Streptomyces sp. NPDC059340 TaxID=3346806 RepID=UPI00369AC4D0
MTAGAYAHPTISRFAIADGMLRIGGLPVGLLAERAGATPFFTYERTGLTRRVEELRRALPDDIHLSYAVKANPMPAVVQHFSRQVDGFDVASAGEMAVALDTPIPADRVSFAGPGKIPAELSRAVAAKVTISLESETEALRVAAIGEWLGVRPRVAVRVNPDFQVKGSGMRLGGGSQQFGVDAEQVPALLTRLAAMDFDVLGFHVFADSQNLYADILAEAHGRTADLVVRLAGAAPQPVRYVNLGGALGIPYFERDQALDLATIGDNLAAVMSERLRPALPEARILLELGRFLVGEAGGYVTRVVDRKESRSHTFLVVDGGLHHQLAASGNFGQAIHKNYPVAIANRMGVPGAETVSVVGCLCTPLDARDVCLPRAEIGDLVAVFQARAYRMTASPTAFLGHPTPTEVLV